MEIGYLFKMTVSRVVEGVILLTKSWLNQCFKNMKFVQAIIGIYLKGSFVFIIIRLIAFGFPLTVLYSREYSNSYGIFRLKLIIYKGVG